MLTLINNKWEDNYWLMICFLLGLVISIYYGIFLREQKNELFYYVYSNLLNNENEVKGIVGTLGLFLFYEKKMLLLWIGGHFSSIIVLLLTFITGFCYGFCVVTFILVFGVESAWIGMLKICMQAIIIFIVIEFLFEKSKDINEKRLLGMKNHLYDIAMTGAGSLCLAWIEVTLDYIVKM